MRAILHTGGAALALIGAKNSGVPFQIGGTASNPVFRPDVKGLASQEVRGLAGGLLGKKKK